MAAGFNLDSNFDRERHPGVQILLVIFTDMLTLILKPKKLQVI
ncbi:MAG: hypothetical protein SRB2_02833 [Desulfobacteraceae bacterium Eth-SRB2]|nr:MAG: hypothetical protein SRB2_02833 [Desulfobacteraceae bacterium Eth-SRB2]